MHASPCCMGMHCNISVLQKHSAIPLHATTANLQLPGAPLSPVSGMGDNVISWLEYSLGKIRFSYSLTRIIISWPIVSIWRLLIHLTLPPLSISFISRLFIRLFLLPSVSPCSLLLQHCPCCLCNTVSQYLVHTLRAPCNFLLNLIILLSFAPTTLTLSFTPFVVALSVLQSHISAMREIKFLLLS